MVCDSAVSPGPRRRKRMEPAFQSAGMLGLFHAWLFVPEDERPIARRNSTADPPARLTNNRFEPDG
jgi:hypothetical protein